jgi:hypothetical protein
MAEATFASSLLAAMPAEQVKPAHEKGLNKDLGLRLTKCPQAGCLQGSFHQTASLVKHSTVAPQA